MSVVCQFPLIALTGLLGRTQSQQRGEMFLPVYYNLKAKLARQALPPTCRCAESLPASRTSLHTAAPADGDQSNHSEQLAAPVPPCMQGCCIYWSPQKMTSFPASQRGNFQTDPGSMSVPRVCQIKKGVNMNTPRIVQKIIFFLLCSRE